MKKITKACVKLSDVRLPQDSLRKDSKNAISPRGSRNTASAMTSIVITKYGDNDNPPWQDSNRENTGRNRCGYEDCTVNTTAKNHSCNQSLSASSLEYRNVNETHPTLKDNKWHLFEGLGRLPGRRAYCLRKDGLLLKMEGEQFCCWTTCPVRRERLVALEKGENDQIYKDEFAHTYEVIARMKDARENTDPQRNVQSSTPQASAQDKEIQKTAALTTIFKQSETTYIYPPCYCTTCSTSLWCEDGFVEVLDHHVVCFQVVEWVQNIYSKMRILTQNLKNHGKRAQRLWKKKTIGQRKDVLAKVSPEFPAYHDIANKVGEHYLCKKPPRDGGFGRNSALITNLSYEELAENDDYLFVHFLLRSSKHPSQLFFTDLLRIQSAIRLLKSVKCSYIFGTFNVTLSQYGRWQRWNNQPIHRFETVVAPYSAIVFECQALILDLLCGIMDELISDLSEYPNQKPERTDQNVLASPNFLHLPVLPDIEPHSLTFPTSSLGIQDAAVIIKAQFTKVVKQLSILRSDNKAFVEHIKTCNAFLEAIQPLPNLARCQSCDISEPTKHFVSSTLSTVLATGGNPQNLSNLHKTETKGGYKSSQRAYHVLAEPHERVITWLYIHHYLEICLEAQKIMGTTSKLYWSALHFMLSALAHRHLILRKTASALCQNPRNSDAIVPRSLIGSRNELNAWLGRYMFAPAWSEGRPIRGQLMRTHLHKRYEEVRSINGLVQDWIEEAAAIVKIYDVLLLNDPTIQLLYAALPGRLESLWFKIQLVPNHDAVCMIKERGNGIKDHLCSMSQYMLPTGERNAEWFQRNEEAKNCLLRTWEGYTEATLKHFVRKEFPATWLEIIERVTIVTAPECSSSATDDKPSALFKSVDSSKSSFVESSIPHLAGTESPSFRKVTKKKREELHTPSASDDAVLLTREHQVCLSQAVLTPKSIRIPIKRSNFLVVKSLFSSAQANVSAVRWLRFLNFMKDAGCKVETGRIGYTFKSQNVANGEQASVNIHRPHPDSTLYAVHLRNVLEPIQHAFGWRKEMFVERT